MLLSIDIAEPLLPVEKDAGVPWMHPVDVAKIGTPSLWGPLKDLHGMGQASVALSRIRGKIHPDMSPEDRVQREAILSVAIKIIDAERELMLRDFAKLLGHALAPK